MRLLLVAIVAAIGGSVYAQTLELTKPLATVSFASGDASLDARARDQLRELAMWMHDHPWRLAVIEAYSDRTGTRAANLALSETRADSVRAELIELGVDPHRIVNAAYGADSATPRRRVIVRGTLDDFRDLVQPTPPRPRGVGRAGPTTH